MEITSELRLKAILSYFGSKMSATFHKSPIHFSADGFEKDDTGEWIKCDGSIIPLDACQLILFDCKDIGENHAKEVAELMSDADYGPLDPDDVPGWIEEVMNGNSATTADYVSGHQMQILTDYLRSRSYNLPFMGIYLVAAGIAIIAPNPERSVATDPQSE